LQEWRDDREREARLERGLVVHHHVGHLQPSDCAANGGGLFLRAGTDEDEQAD
jgi:hypothetical protein